MEATGPDPESAPAGSGDERRRPGCALLVAVLVFVALVPFAIYGVLVVAADRVPVRARDQRATCVQPDDVDYADGRYEVTAWQVSTWSIGSDREEAVVGREGGSATYGVPIALSPGADAGGLTCQWGPDAVLLVESNGITHRVPAAVFTGGR